MAVICIQEKKTYRCEAFLTFLCLCLLSVWIAVRADSAADAHWSAASGEVLTNGKLVVDAGNASEGYFIASVPGGSGNRLKLRVAKEDFTLTYDLDQGGAAEVFPFQLGSGDYVVSLYENAGEKKYSQEGTITISVQLSREDAAFLYPNQYVNYAPDSAVVAEADSVCAGLSGRAAYDAIQAYMTTGFTYDYIKSVTVEPGLLPDLDYCMAHHMGTCQDLSAVMTAMLRSQGIPAKLVIGYADNNYHAWSVANVDGEELFFDPTLALNAIGTPKDYTVERYY